MNLDTYATYTYYAMAHCLIYGVGQAKYLWIYTDMVIPQTNRTFIFLMAWYKFLYPSAWADQRGPLGDKENITQWFWCQTINILQSFLL